MPCKDVDRAALAVDRIGHLQPHVPAVATKHRDDSAHDGRVRLIHEPIEVASPPPKLRGELGIKLARDPAQLSDRDVLEFGPARSARSRPVRRLPVRRGRLVSSHGDDGWLGSERRFRYQAFGDHRRCRLPADHLAMRLVVSNDCHVDRLRARAGVAPDVQVGWPWGHFAQREVDSTSVLRRCTAISW